MRKINDHITNIPNLPYSEVPTKKIGPIRIKGQEIEEDIYVPLSTYEKPLWASTQRGAKISVLSEGINVVIHDDRMTRSIIIETNNAILAYNSVNILKTKKQDFEKIIKQNSKFTSLIDMHFQVVANLIYLRLEMKTGDASGHNMVTKAANEILTWIVKNYPELKHVSVSGNYCTDKKVSAVNGILGRGKYVVAEIKISDLICNQYLRTTPQKIVDLNIKKNLIGSLLAGGVRSANAHFANILLAIYLATGQDAANIIEGSQGIVYTEVREKELYFSVTLPNIIVGTIGSGKNLNFVKKNLSLLGCDKNNKVGANAQRLAIITAATVLCGEISLLAALTNPGELIKSHLKIEREK